MKRLVLPLIIVALLVSAAPFGVSLAARVFAPLQATATSCGSTHLASPDYQAPDTVDYFVHENVIMPTTTAQIHLAAYAIPGTQNLGTPHVIDHKVLDSSYHEVPPGPDRGGAWAMDTDPCYADPNQKPVTGSKSDRYYFEGTWTAPNRTGSYELKVAVAFEDGTVVNYLVNMEIMSPPPPGQSLPQFNSFVRDAVDVNGIDGASQDTVNNAYDLTKFPDQLDMVTTYYFQGNPSPDGTSKMANAMLDADVAAQNVFQNIDESGGNGHGGGADNRVVLPLSGSARQPLTYDQSYIGADKRPHSLTQRGGWALVQPYQEPAGVVSDQSYSHIALLHEPITVRMGAPADPMYLLKVGRYTVDNGFFGPVADNRNTVGVNFGAGHGFTFYANPGHAVLDRSADHAKCNRDTTKTCVYWNPAPPSVVGENTRLTYHLHINVLDPALPRGEDPTVVDVDVPGDQPWYNIDPNLISLMRTGRYDASVLARFQITDDNGKAIPVIESVAQSSRLATGADAPGGPVDTPTPPAADTATPIATPVPPTDTATPTAVPPTDTPTPTTGPAQGALASVATPYAWLAGRVQPGATVEAILPTTRRGGSPDRDTTHFAWPAGIPLRVLPALSEHPDQVSLALRDPSGAEAFVHPAVVDSIGYSVNGGACGAGTLAAAGTYTHDGAAYPGEIAPLTGQTVLPGAVSLTWTLGAAGSGASEPNATEHGLCSVTDYLAHAAGHALPARLRLAYTITQRLQFALVFHNGAQGTAVGGAGASVCPVRAVVPQVAATPGPAFDTATAPLDGAAVGACDAGDVRLLAVQKALASGTIAHDGSLESATVYGTPTVTANGDGTTTLRVSFEVRRSLALAYHLVMLHEIGP